jgi:monooxygenase
MLPSKLAYGITRWKNVLRAAFFFQLSRRRPELVKKFIRAGVRQHLGPDYDIDTHFKPRYNPWDERMCLVPDGDLFEAISAGKVDVVTDHIETFTEHGLRLRSGAELEADLVVTATGLNLIPLGGMALEVDGRPVDPSEAMGYKGMMLSDVPNLASAFGYTNASWTLKCDLTCAYMCRLLNHMEQHGYRQCVAHNTDPSVAALPFVDFTSGYIQRAIHLFPKQGSKAPWRLYQNYLLDIVSLRYGSFDDGAMHFSSPKPPAPARPVPAAAEPAPL